MDQCEPGRTEKRGGSGMMAAALKNENRRIGERRFFKKNVKDGKKDFSLYPFQTQEKTSGIFIPGPYKPACFSGANGCVFYHARQGRKYPVCLWSGLKFDFEFPYLCNGFIPNTEENKAVFGLPEERA